MVVARQRPETAKGIVFMLLEDERGTVNLIVPPPVYERHRAVVRAAPLLRARGRLERREGIDQRPRLRGPPSSSAGPAPIAEWRAIPAWRGQVATRRAEARAPSPSCAPSPPPATAGAGEALTPAEPRADLACPGPADATARLSAAASTPKQLRASRGPCQAPIVGTA